MFLLIQSSDDVVHYQFHRFQPVSLLLSQFSQASFHQEMRRFLSIQGQKIQSTELVRTYAEPKFERSPCRPARHRCCNRTVNFSPAALATSHRPTLPITLSFGAMIRSIVSYAARSRPPGRCGSTCAIRFHSATRAIYSLTTRCSTSDIRISLKWYDDSGAATPTQ